MTATAVSGTGRTMRDCRLVATSIGCWGAALACVGMPLRGSLILLACVLGGLGLLAASARLVAGRHRHGGGAHRHADPGRSAAGWVAVALLLGMLVGSVATAAREVDRDRGPISHLARTHQRAMLQVVLRDDPRPVVAAGRRESLVVPVTVLAVASGDQTVPRRGARGRALVFAPADGWRGLLPGQRVTVEGQLAPSRSADLTAAVVYAQGPPLETRSPPWYQRLAGSLRQGLVRACSSLPAEPRGLVPGLVLGDTRQMDPTLAEDFRATGMTHLTAVSGSNCAIVIGLVLTLCRWMRCGPVLAAAVGTGSLLAFVILVRASPSVVRAAVMAAIAMLALALGRPRAAVAALSATVVLAITVDPDLSRDPGFALSVLATTGLLVLAPGWVGRLRRRGVPGGLAHAVVVPMAAQVMCVPMIASLSGTVSLSAVPANLCAAPAVAPATLLGVGATLLAPAWMGGAAYTAWLASWPVRWLGWIAHLGAGVPLGVLPWKSGTAGAGLAVLVGVLCAALWRLRTACPAWARRWAAVLVLAAVLGALPVRLLTASWPPAGWVAVVCDVGQGDLVVLSGGPGAVAVVDTGPDPASATRCLRGIGIGRVDLLLISHAHADHIGGLGAVLRQHPVGALVVGAAREPGAGRRQIDAAAGETGVPVRTAARGDRYDLGRLRLEVVAAGQEPVTGGSDANNRSLVVRAEIGAARVLLPGDAETGQQEALLESVGAEALRADVLKVAHHGSAYQSDAFLRAVRPGLAVVSVGAGNRLGHPNPKLLEGLAGRGVRVRRTDTAGDVAVLLGARGRLGSVSHRSVRGRAPG